MQEQQNLMCQLQGILEALDVVHRVGSAKAGETVLIGVAVKLAEINNCLDTASLPDD